MEFFREANLKILDKRRYAYILSAILILIGLISLVLKGGPKYGVDFTGGTSVQLKFEKAITPGDIRSALSRVNMANAEIKRIGFEEENEFLIRVELVQEGGQVAITIEQSLTNAYPDNPYDIRAVNEVGPKIGGELRRAAIMAVLIALMLLLIYISWRFEFKFAVGAVVALFHDVLITLGAFSIFNFEINLVTIAAFLTIVGYSLNDTIVVFDRIRENLKIMRRETLEHIINKSVNQTLSRTIITSGTTLLVVVMLFIFGGEVLRGFSFALLIGIGIGTYSSIFVASPVVLEWQNRFAAKKAQKPLLRPSR